MAAINTVDDLIEVLKRDGKVRSAVRREILTEELLAVPERVDSMQKTQTEMLAQITALREDFGSMQKAQDGMLTEIRALRKDFGSMQKTQDGVLTEIRGLKEGQRDAAEHRDILHRRYRREHDAMHRFRGNYAIDAARKNRVAIAEEFAQLEGLTDIDVEVLDEARLRVMRNREPESPRCPRHQREGEEFIPHCRPRPRGGQDRGGFKARVLHRSGGFLHRDKEGYGPRDCARQNPQLLHRLGRPRCCGGGVGEPRDRRQSRRRRQGLPGCEERW